MKIKLNKNEIFWSLINPTDIEDIRIILNTGTPESEIDFEKEPKWAQSQIFNSIQSGRIISDVALSESKKEETKAEVKAISAKPVSQKKVTKKVKQVE